MHEFSFATQVIEALMNETEDRKITKIKEIFIEIGALLTINPEQLSFAMDVLMKDTIAEGMKIHIKLINPKIRCEDGHVSDMPMKDNHPIFSDLKCPVCSKKATMEGGRDFCIRKIVV